MAGLSFNGFFIEWSAPEKPRSVNVAFLLFHGFIVKYARLRTRAILFGLTLLLYAA